MATEAFAGLIFCLDPAVAFVCQCVKPIDLNHWSNSSRILLSSTRSVDRFYTFGHSMHVDWLSISLLPSDFQVGDGRIERIFTFFLV